MNIFTSAVRGCGLVLPVALLVVVGGVAATPAHAICDRTQQVQDAIVGLVGSGKTCATVTNVDLGRITGRLNLSRKSIAALKANDFAGLAGLDSLNLSGNSLTTLPENVFAGLAELDTLYLNKNSLTTLPENVFVGLAELDTLSLNNNSLTTLPENVFAGLAELDALNLYYNSLAALPENVFAGLAELDTLYLYNNSLTTLPENVFAGLAELDTLLLINNSLTTLPENVFAGLAELDTLYLYSNSLTTLPANVFAGLADLDALSLTGNSLTTLPANVFAGLVELDELSLSNNSLTTLPENVFAGLVELDLLYLRNNPLTTLPVDAFNGLSPDTLSISGIANLPAPPSEVRVTPQTRALRVEWDAVTVAGGAHYQLRWKPAAATTFAPEDAAAVTGTGHIITGLANGTTYEVRVAAVPSEPQQTSSYDLVSWLSTSGTQRTLNDKPGKTQKLGVEADNAQLSVSWDAPASDGGAPVTTYHVRWKPLTAARYSTATTQATTYTIENLANGTTYEVQVAAQNPVGTGAYTDAMQGTPRTVPGAPQSVEVVPGDAELRINWAAPADNGGADVTTYHLRWKPQAATTFAPANRAAVSAPTLAHTIAGLENGTTYEVQVAAENPAGAGAYADAMQGTPRTVPGAPQSVEVEPGDAELRITWAVPDDNGGADVTTYHLRWKPQAATTFASADRVALNAQTFAYDITDLNNGTAYETQVAAENSIGVGAYADAMQGTPRTVPGAPQSVEVAPGDAELRITWAAPNNNGGADVTTYLLRWKPKAATTFAPADRATVSAPTLAHTIAGLENGAAYEVQIAAQNPAGAGDYTDAMQGTPRTVPGAPQSVAADPGDTELRITWAMPNADGGATVTSYRLRWKLADSADFAADDMVVVGADSFAHAITGLENGMEYEVEVAAKNPAGFGDGTTAQATPRTVPGAPKSVAAAPGDRQLRIIWAAPDDNGGADVTTYHLRWKPQAAATFAPADSVALNAPTLTHTITGLENGAAYEVQVAAQNPAGAGDYADAIQATPRTTPGAPQSVEAAPGDAELRITWAVPDDNGGTDVTTYHLRWKAQAAAAFAPADHATVNAPTRAHNITDLANCRAYEVEVAAQNSAGVGAWSASAHATPHDFNLDVDDSGTVTAADGIMVARYLLGVTSDGLTRGQADAGKSAAIAAKIQCGVDVKALDADGDGDVDKIDGILILRYLLGLRGDALVAALGDVKADDVAKKLDIMMRQSQ